MTPVQKGGNQFRCLNNRFFEVEIRFDFGSSTRFCMFCFVFGMLESERKFFLKLTCGFMT